MLRFNLSLLATVLATTVALSDCEAQSGSRGSGTIINSAPSQPYRSQPIQSQPYQGQIINQGSGSTSRPVQGSSSIGSSQMQPGSSSTGSSTMQSGSGAMGSNKMQSGASSFEGKFWKYLSASRYKNWAPVPGKTGDIYPGKSPHGATLKMYLNRTAAGRPSELPDSSIIVKENYGPNGQQLMAITVMYKTKGFNAQAADWYWIKYRPDGTVDEKVTNGNRMKLAGKPNGCIECHSSAAGGDYAFFNDNM